MRVQSWPLLAGFIVLAALIGARMMLTEVQRANREEARSAILYQQTVSALLSSLLEAESAQRGYLLTGRKPYLAPYTAAVADTGRKLAAIEALAAGDADLSAQAAPIRTAVSDKLAELAQTIRLYDQGDRDGAIAVVDTDKGLAAMATVRDMVKAIQEDSQADLQARFSRTDSIEGWLRIASFAGLAGVLLLALLVTRMSGRSLANVIAAQEALDRKNAELMLEMNTRAQAETQVRQLQKMEAIGQLTGGIAHDFNNMLAVILSAMNVLQRKVKRGDYAIEGLVADTIEAAQRAAGLTKRLLAFSRQQPLSPQVIDINALVGGMSELLSRAIGETVVVETVRAGGLWRTHVDPGQLENAILNLAVNSRDAMNGEGKLTIETGNVYLDEAYAHAHAEVKAGPYVMVAVTDTGCGMTDDVMTKAFEPFFTTKPPGRGTGLGLSQVFGFVKQTGGHVKIYSEPDQGTTIKMYFPRHFGEAPRTAPAVAREQPVSKPTETILVAEDDDRVRAATISSLRELGYVAVEAANGEQALQALAENSAVALLFTDIVMPGMSGRKLADEARKLYPKLKVVFTTGFTRNAVVHNGVLDHDVHFIAKPFTLEQLAGKLREALDGGQE